LRRTTAVAHRHVEGAPAVRALLAGTMPRAHYVRLLSALVPVYRALEGWAPLVPELARALPFAALARAERLRADLHALGATPRPSPAGERYAERLTQVAYTAAPRLWGHVYVRYLGDLSGGQIMARAVAKAFGERATSFYDFGPPARVAELKERIRGGLDGVAPAAHADVGDEAARAFALSEALFVEAGGA
jgi:heme oxygenase (biliverdin-producing, ferredoxin)